VTKKRKKESPGAGKQQLLVGITGGIGAGKSAVASVYREAGYTVISADEIAREIVRPGSPALKEIRLLFGAQAIKLDGNLDRAFVRAKITADPELRLKLEAITHPRIQKRSLELAQAAFADGEEIVFYEAPLLFEAKSDHSMDKVICVHAPDEVRIERTMKRDGSAKEAAEKLLASQMPQDEKMRLSDFLVRNSGSLAEMQHNAMEVLKELKAVKAP
jgi:dephospho-CoA kinase